jgi:hypothetical protein
VAQERAIEEQVCVHAIVALFSGSLRLPKRVHQSGCGLAVIAPQSDLVLHKHEPVHSNCCGSYLCDLVAAARRQVEAVVVRKRRASLAIGPPSTAINDCSIETCMGEKSVQGGRPRLWTEQSQK